MDKILKASYGDQAQREINARAPQSAQAAQIEAAYKERRAAKAAAELPVRPSGNGPLFWDPKNHGTPYGRQSPGRGARHARVEIRPGIYHEVSGAAGARPGAVGAAGAGGGPRPGRPSSAPVRGRPGPAGAAGVPAGVRALAAASPGGGRGLVELQPEVAALEGRMREALRRTAAVHIKERTVLLQAFAAVLGRRHTELGLRDKVTAEQFIGVWRRLGLSLSAAHAAAFFAKYGCDARGGMPVMMFVDALVMGAPRLDMAANDVVQKGPYEAGRPAMHTGKILYPECKKGVWPPSNWDPRVAERSAQLPDCSLQLEFVHGYDGFQATCPNIFYTASGRIVYHVAALGVVYDKESHTQAFFHGHDDDVLCTALCPADRTTVATGQLGRQPCVLVWDSGSGRQLARLNVDREYRGIQALAFSPDGRMLAGVSRDNSHSLHVWDWARGKALCEPRKSQPGAPPAVYGVVWSPFEPGRLVTYGQNHIRFWSLAPDPRGAAGALAPASTAGVYSLGKTHTVTGAAFLRSGVVLTGNGRGCICSWRGGRLVRETAAHAPGAPERRPDGKPGYGGVRCLVLQGEGRLLSGGADGVVRQWDVSGGDLGPLLRQWPLLLLTPGAGDMGAGPGAAPPAIRGLDCDPANPDMFVAGTASCDVWEVDADPRVLVAGQRGDLYGVAPNPAFAHVYATACDSDQVTVWSAATRKPLRIVSLGGLVARSVAFSPDGQQLAVGCGNGGITVLEFHPAVRQVWWGKPFNSGVAVLSYSPCGTYLAAGGHDQCIDVFDVRRGYARVCRCAGASSTIRHLDWAADSGALQANDAAYEILHFDPRTGRQLKENLRDRPWAGWSCLLGFPAMGVWFPGSDGTDINALHASPCGRYVLTADDRGRVRLLAFPCVVRNAPAREYGGHSSHVMGVRWAADGAVAVSVGGKDRAVFQWRCTRQAARGPARAGPAPWAQLDAEGVVWAAPRQGQGAAEAQGPMGHQHQPGRSPGVRR